MMHVSMKHVLQAALLTCLAAPFAGCHSVSSALMVPEKVTIEQTIGGSARVAASGSEKQGLFGPSIVDDEGLEAAVTEALLGCGLFDEISTAGTSQHLVEVSVEKFVEPEVGFDTSCEVTLRWSLKSGDGSAIRWAKSITTSASMNSYEEMDSSLRPQLVMEKAMRENLAAGIRALSTAAPKAPKAP